MGIPWMELRLAYVQRPDEPSIRDISNEYGVHWTTVARHSSKEDWVALRKAYQEKVGAIGTAMTGPHSVSAASRLANNPDKDPAHIKYIRLIEQIINVIFFQLQPKDMVLNEDGSIKDCSIKVTHMPSFVGLTKSLKDLIQLRKDLNWHDTPATPGMPSLGVGDGSIEQVVAKVNTRLKRMDCFKDLVAAGEAVVSRLDGAGGNIIDAEATVKDTEPEQASPGPPAAEPTPEPAAVLEKELGRTVPVAVEAGAGEPEPASQEGVAQALNEFNSGGESQGEGAAVRDTGAPGFRLGVA